MSKASELAERLSKHGYVPNGLKNWEYETICPQLLEEAAVLLLEQEKAMREAEKALIRAIKYTDWKSVEMEVLCDALAAIRKVLSQ